MHSITFWNSIISDLFSKRDKKKMIDAINWSGLMGCIPDVFFVCVCVKNLRKFCSLRVLFNLMRSCAVIYGCWCWLFTEQLFYLKKNTYCPSFWKPCLTRLDSATDIIVTFSRIESRNSEFWRQRVVLSLRSFLSLIFSQRETKNRFNWLIRSILKWAHGFYSSYFLYEFV